LLAERIGDTALAETWLMRAERAAIAEVDETTRRTWLAQVERTRKEIRSKIAQSVDPLAACGTLALLLRERPWTTVTDELARCDDGVLDAVLHELRVVARKT
jgi:hypothetical protein